jgi:GMP synthase-like glutamine amidotransferase
LTNGIKNGRIRPEAGRAAIGAEFVMPNVHILQHVSFEGPGAIADWCRKQQCSVSVTKFFETDWCLPEPAEFDLLVVMGGPMSVNDEDQYDWLTPEKRFIADAIAHSNSVLGVCLGAQLIASVLGASVVRSAEPEIGWFPVKKTAEAAGVSPVRGFPMEQHVFHWHGETFDLPAGCTRLFGSRGCFNQGFIHANNVVGLQFHAEVTPADIRAFLEYNAADLELTGRYVQTPIEIAERDRCGALLVPMHKLLDELISLAPIGERQQLCG